ncbi:MAG: response regulator [Bacteroidales bacterium]|nr:response regulator [Bacteroidales bacterium]
MKPLDHHKRHLRGSLLFLILFLSANICSAQFLSPVFENISTKDGLSHSSVNYMLQDHNGFMWFATYNGLNKYDGKAFKVYQKNDQDKTSISSNDIFFIYEDTSGNIWIVNSVTGLDRFDPITETFENYRHNPDDPESISSNELFQVTQDSNGNVWVCAGDALNLYVPPAKNDHRPGRFEKFRLQGSTASITYAFEESKEDLLLFSDYLYSFNHKERKITNTGIRLENTLVTSVVKDMHGDLLLGTVLHGVLKLEYDEATRSYKRVDPGKINVAPGKRSRLFMDHNKHIWIGTEGGLFRYQPETDMLEHFLPDDLDDKSISDNTIYSLYEDNTGVIWIGTFSKGVDKYDFYRKQFLHFKKIPYRTNSLSGNVVSSIHGLEPNEVWVGLDVGGGINRILFSGAQEPKIIHYQNDPLDQGTIGGNSILCLLQRKNGEVWAGIGGGTVAKIKPEIPFSGNKPVIKNYIFDRWTFSIYEDSDGILWGGTWDAGLWRYNEKTDQFDFFLPDSGNMHSLCDKVIWAIGEDSHKNIWIGGHGNGLSILTADEKRKDDPKFINYSNAENDSLSLSNNTINAFCQARDGNFWICTAGGLNKVHNPTGITGSYADFPDLLFISYHIADGLPSEGIVGIVEDNQGYIWTSTNFGISRMDPQKEEFTNYNVAHGLQSNEFWHNAYFKNTHGVIFFGGENGFNAFHPEKIIPNPFLPKVVVTELLLFNKKVKVGDVINKQEVLKEPVYKAKEIRFSYKNNIITFQFAALHYAQPSLNQYAYYLEGFEDEWNYSGNQSVATYTNLDPGTYTFRVKATNSDGIWSDKEVALKVVVRPPWWNTLFMKIAIPLMLILLVLGVFRIRLSILKRQKELLQDTVNKRTEELQEVNSLLEEKQEEILMQNEELLRHRNNLEELIRERTHQLENAKQKAEESDQLKSSFLANMSHEIRTPMNAILGFSSLLKEREFSEEEKEGFIRTINQNGETLMYLIDDILDISLIESNQLVMKPQSFNAHTVLTEMEEFWRLKNEKGLAVEFVNKKEKELILHIDPVRFKQVMNNLLSNAMKYTQKGFIRFGYEIIENNIRFFVADSGIGIEPKHKERVFEHFFKIESDSEKVYRGTGIGLAICKKIVGLLNGKIWVESTPETGSTFYFTIPFIDLPGQDRGSKTISKIVPPLSLERFFYVIAEDEPANYEILVKMLRIPKEKHFWGKNGKEAVAYIEKQKNHDNILVLMDIKMPVMNGYDALQAIKKINWKIPVIAVTAYALKHEEKEILAKGFDGYLSKPINAEKLKEIIGRMGAFQK